MQNSPLLTTVGGNMDRGADTSGISFSRMRQRSIVLAQKGSYVDDCS
jgi:hypothetical protein